MKVLITVPCLDLPGGVANYYRTLRGHLDEDKVYFEIGARPRERGRWPTLRRLVADYWRFHRELGRRSFDLVHINPSLGMRSLARDGLLVLIAKAHGRPVLIFFRGWDPACEAAIRARHARLFRFAYGRADALVVLAQEFAHSLRALGLRAPVIVETTVVADSSFDVPRAGTSVGLDAGACEILYLSRLDRGKGLGDAIEAVALLAARFPTVTLTIAGDGPERAPAEAIVKGRGLRGVRFAGHLGDEARGEAFRGADIFLFTSLAEGMPNAVLEAMAHGLPVVTRAVGGVKDFFEDSRMGYVTESTDPATFAALLARLVVDPALRAAMGSYNREFARRRFAGSVVAARLLDIYAQVRRQSAAR